MNDTQTIREIAVAVARVEEKLDALLASDLERRVGSMERWRSKVNGIGYVVTALITAATGFVSSHWNIKL